MNDESLSAQQSETERSLRESQRRLATLLSNLPGIAYRCKNDRDWTMEFVSDGCQTLTGYKPTDLVGSGALPYNSLIHPDDRDRIWTEVQEALTQRLPFKLTYRIHTADGQEKWVWEQGVGIYSGAELEALEGFITDITELKEAERTLQDAEAKYRNLFEGALEGLYRTSMEGKPITGNPALAKMLGYESPEEGVLAVNDVALQVWLDPDKRSDFLKLLQDQGVVLGYECQFKRKDGAPVWVSLNSRIVRDVDGTALYVEGFVEDITRRKRSETALKQANEAIAEVAANLSALIESTDDLIGSFDLEYRLLTFNKALADSIKWTVGLQAVFGMRLEEWLPAEKFALWPPMFDRALREGPFRAEYPLIDGRRLELSFNPIRQDGGTVGISVFGKDITERKRAQATIQQANEALAGAERHYRLMFNSVSDAVFVHKFGKDGLPRPFLEVNDNACRLLGYTREELLQMRVVDIIATEEQFNAPANAKRLLAEGHRNWEGLLSLKDGRRIPVEVNARVFDLDGSPTIISSMRDISERKDAEARLQTQNQRFQRIVENTDVGYFRMGLDGRWEDVNPAWLRMHGFTGREEAIGQYFSAVLNPEDQAKAKEIGQALIRGESVRSAELSRLRRDGTIGYQTCSANPVLDGDKIVGIEGFIVDISERKRMEDALRKSEERFAKAFRSGPAMTVLFGPDEEGNRIIDVSEAFEQGTGYRREEVLGRTRSELGLWADPCDIDVYMNQLRTNGRTRNCEFRFRRKNGDIANGLVSSEWIEVGGKRCSISAAIDITEQKKTEEAMRSLATAIEQSAETIVITDLDGKIQYCNPAFEKITGYSKEEAIGQNPSVLKSGKHDKAFYQQMWATITLGKVWSGHLINKKKDGSLYEEDATISPIRDASGKLSGFVAIKRDVTERLQLEDQLRQAQKLESVGRLAGGVAHDFNNLLTVINGYSDFLLERLNATDPLRSYATQIRDAGERAASLTKQLLAFSRKQLIEPKVIDLNTTIRQSAPMLQRLIGEDIDLETYLDQSLGQVLADADQIYQVIMNLAVNARDAMPDGGTLDIETTNVALDQGNTATMHHEATPGRYVLMSVTDTGHGMNEKTRQQIFEPFFTTKEIGKGTGLGLSTVYGIIRQSGGWIEVQSDVGVGTSFKVYLPRIDASLAPEEQIGAATQKGSETILLVEDQEAVRSFALAALERYGYHVIEASDGEGAIAAAGNYSREIHLLLTDVVLPGMNGKELSEILKSSRPNLKVLFTSGYTADVIGNRGVLGPDVAFLHKPFSPEELAAKVRDVLTTSVE
jgi:two-component system, cell cycle sensor histidine kinase and response regulator CckA